MCAETPRRRVRRKPLPGYKACRNCRAVVPESEQKCPYCGGTEFSEEWYGLIIIVNPEKSCLAKALGVNRKGMFAIDVP